MNWLSLAILGMVLGSPLPGHHPARYVRAWERYADAFSDEAEDRGWVS